MESFTEKLKRERILKNWSIGELSRKSGIPITTIYNYEKGTKPTLEKADLLFKAMGISLVIGIDE